MLRAEDTLRDSEEESDDSLSSAEDYSEPEEENGQHCTYNLAAPVGAVRSLITLYREEQDPVDWRRV